MYNIMKSKQSVFALMLIGGLLPAALQGVPLLDGGGGGGKGDRPRAERRIAIPPVMIEIASGTVSLTFTCDLGEATVDLWDATGSMVVNQSVNASAQANATFTVPAGVYLLAITTADGMMLMETNIVVP